MESFFAGLLGVLVGKGISQEEASSIVKALRGYLGFEPPVGLKGFVLCDLATGQARKSAVVVRGKTYDAEALEDLTKYDEVSVLARSGEALQVARTITHMTDVETIDQITSILSLANLSNVETIEQILSVVNLANIGNIQNIENVESANIKTLDGTNIIIDLLKQGAYTPRHAELSNNGETPSWATPFQVKYGKFFPRGARGFIKTLYFYVKNDGISQRTLSYSISPQIGMGALVSGTITIPSSQNPAWLSKDIERMWNYDSMFIWLTFDHQDAKIAFDAGEDYDLFFSGDGGVTWDKSNGRLWAKVSSYGMTVGDLPVGIVNTIELPTVTGRIVSEGVNVPDNEETTIVTVAGAGTMLEAKLTWLLETATPSSSVGYYLYIYADGDLVDLTRNMDLTQSETATSGRSSKGEFFQDSTDTHMRVRIPVKFRRELKITAKHKTGNQKTVSGAVSCNILS